MIAPRYLYAIDCQHPVIITGFRHHHQQPRWTAQRRCEVQRAGIGRTVLPRTCVRPHCDSHAVRQCMDGRVDLGIVGIKIRPPHRVCRGPLAELVIACCCHVCTPPSANFRETRKSCRVRARHYLNRPSINTPHCPQICRF